MMSKWYNNTNLYFKKSCCTELEENDGRLMAYVVKNDESLREVLDNNGDTLESFLENNRQEDILLKPGITVMIDKNGKNNGCIR